MLVSGRVSGIYASFGWVCVGEALTSWFYRYPSGWSTTQRCDWSPTSSKVLSLKTTSRCGFSKKRGPAFEITWCNEISYNIPCTSYICMIYLYTTILCIYLVYLCHITCTTTVLLQYFCLQMFEAEVTTAYNISVHQHTPNLKENLIKWPDNPVHDLCSSSSFLLDFWFRPLAPSFKILTFFPDVETIYRMIRGFNECLWRTSHVELLVTASNASSTRRSLKKKRLRDAGWFVQKSS